MLLHVVVDSINRSKKNNATNIIIMFCRFCKSHDARPALLYQPRIHESTQSKRYESHYRRTCYIHFIALVFPFLWYLFAAQDRSKAATKRLSRFIFTRDCILQRGSTFLRELQRPFQCWIYLQHTSGGHPEIVSHAETTSLFRLVASWPASNRWNGLKNRVQNGGRRPLIPLHSVLSTFNRKFPSSGRPAVT